MMENDLKRVIYWIIILGTTGLATLLAITAVSHYANQILTTPILKLLGAIILYAVGLWASKNFKEWK